MAQIKDDGALQQGGKIHNGVRKVSKKDGASRLGLGLSCGSNERNMKQESKKVYGECGDRAAQFLYPGLFLSRMERLSSQRTAGNALRPELGGCEISN
jgi:hypothetical protein